MPEFEMPDTRLEQALEAVLIRYEIPAELTFRDALGIGVPADRGDLSSDLATAARKIGEQMGWGEQHSMGTGNTQQVEDAHKALDAVGVQPGLLAVRVLEVVGMIDRLNQRIHSVSDAHDA